MYIIRVTFYLCIMGCSQGNEMAASRRTVSMHALMWLVILVISQLNHHRDKLHGIIRGTA